MLKQDIYNEPINWHLVNPLQFPKQNFSSFYEKIFKQIIAG